MNLLSDLLCLPFRICMSYYVVSGYLCCGNVTDSTGTPRDKQAYDILADLYKCVRLLVSVLLMWGIIVSVDNLGHVSWE